MFQQFIQKVLSDPKHLRGGLFGTPMINVPYPAQSCARLAQKDLLKATPTGHLDACAHLCVEECFNTICICFQVAVLHHLNLWLNAKSQTPKRATCQNYYTMSSFISSEWNKITTLGGGREEIVTTNIQVHRKMVNTVKLSLETQLLIQITTHKAFLGHITYLSIQEKLRQNLEPQQSSVIGVGMEFPLIQSNKRGGFYFFRIYENHKK